MPEEQKPASVVVSSSSSVTDPPKKAESPAETKKTDVTPSTTETKKTDLPVTTETKETDLPVTETKKTDLPTTETKTETTQLLSVPSSAPNLTSPARKQLMQDINKTQQLREQVHNNVFYHSSLPISRERLSVGEESLLEEREIERKKKQRGDKETHRSLFFSQSNRDLEETIARKLREAEQLKKQLAGLEKSASAPPLSLSSPLTRLAVDVKPVTSGNIIAASEAEVPAVVERKSETPPVTNPDEVREEREFERKREDIGARKKTKKKREGSRTKKEESNNKKQ